MINFNNLIIFDNLNLSKNKFSKFNLQAIIPQKSFQKSQNLNFNKIISKNLEQISEQISAENLYQNRAFSSFFDKINPANNLESDLESDSKTSFHKLNTDFRDTNFRGIAPNLAKTLMNFKLKKQSDKSKNLVNFDLTLTQSETIIGKSLEKLTGKNSTIIDFKKTKPASTERRFLLQNSIKIPKLSEINKSKNKELSDFNSPISKIVLEKSSKIQNAKSEINLWQNSVKNSTLKEKINLNIDFGKIKNLTNIYPILLLDSLFSGKNSKINSEIGSEISKAKSQSSKSQNPLNFNSHLGKSLENILVNNLKNEQIWQENLNKISKFSQKSTQIWANSQIQILKNWEFLKLLGNLIITFLVQIWESLLWQSFLLWGQIQSLTGNLQNNFQKSAQKVNNLKLNLTNNLANKTSFFQTITKTTSQNNFLAVPNFQSNFFRELNLFSTNFANFANSSTNFSSNFSSNFLNSKIQETQQEFSKKIDSFWQFFEANLQRDFWWLELKLETRKVQMKILRKLQNIMQKWSFLVKKLYLVVWVILLLGIFNFGNFGSLSNLGKPKTKVQFDSISVARNSVIDFRSFNSTPKNEIKDLIKDLNVKKITAHTFTKDDSIAKLAELYNLSVRSIEFNNQIENTEPEIGKILYIPWQNGYILHLQEETSATEISKTWKLEESLIIETNKSFWNEKTAKFAKNTLILLPSVDFDQIIEIQKNEKNRIITVQEANKQRDKMLNYTAVENNQGNKKTGFIWPAVGTISRCLQPGHIACDIANFASPPIFAVADAVVLESGWRDGGFGYMALLDHGNGLQTMYMHMENVQIVKGQKLLQGQTIGKMGCTGNCSGTHLHFEVRQNKIQQNPLLYLP